MPFSYAQYAGNGSATTFSVPFPYLLKAHVKVYIGLVIETGVFTTLLTDGVGYTWTGGTQIQATAPPAAGAQLTVRRETPNGSQVVVWNDGSNLIAEDLNISDLQSFYVVQEWVDYATRSNEVSQEAIAEALAAVATANAALPKAGGTMTGPIVLSDNPTAALQAAPKQYIDAADALKLNLTGGTMTGPIVLSDNPTAALQAAPKQYTDAADALKLNLTGGTMTGPIVLASNPAQPLQSTPKQYVDAADAVLQANINTRWDKSSDTINSAEAWLSQDDKVSTNKAADTQFSTLVQPLTPAGTSWPVGKTWLQNDANKALSIWNGSGWIGVASGGTFTTQPSVIYVDAANGNDADDGHRIINPKKTIKAAVIAAAAGDIIKVAPGVYQEILPIDITVTNLSIVGEAQRSCFIHPTVATEEQTMFRCNSGTYLDGFTFAGLKASGTRGGHYVDTNPTYGLPTNQGWVASFLPGCTITKSPYVNNCTNFADSGINNSSFNPNNHGGTGGDVTSAPTGGGILVDGSVPNVNSPLRSFVINEFTQLNLDGPGLLVCNNGYVQAVSFFGIFCHYHAKALSGGQINMEVGTTNFGRYGLIADGKSSTAIFTATANGNASVNATAFAINAPTAGSAWFGDATRPALNMLVQVSGNLYPILSATANGFGWNVVISRPNPSNRIQNLGLISGHSGGVAVSFFLRSMISTASHTHEYTGAGTNYTAMPENGGVPQEVNESVNLNDGRVWLSSVDQNGKFKVGDTFIVDQQTGFVSIDPSSTSTNLVSDLSPKLGADLDVLTRKIFSSLGNVAINDALEVIGGSAATPSLTFTGDLNTGIFSPGADQLAISTNGTGRLFVDGSGRLLVGTSTSRAVTAGFSIGWNPRLQVTKTGVDAANIAAYSFSTYAVDLGGGLGIGPDIVLAHSNSDTEGTQAAIANNMLLGRITFNGSDGTAFQSGAFIAAASDGQTWASGDCPARLVFFTTADNAASPTERMRIDRDGRVLVGTSSTNTSGAKLQTSDGLTFPATAVASADVNTLDDYEEGTWTPVVSFGGASVGITGGFSGTYTKVGNVVTVLFKLVFTAKGTSTGNMLVSGMPFSSGGGNDTISGFGYVHRLATLQTAGQMYFQLDGTNISLRFFGYNLSNTSSLTNTDISDTTDLRAGAVFRV